MDRKDEIHTREGIRILADKIDDRFDRVHDAITAIQVTLERNTVVLEQNTKDVAVHIKRTNALEEQLEVALLPMKIAKWLAAALIALASLSTITYTIMVLLGKAKP